MAINGKRIYLRAMEPEDMELYREMINDQEMSRMVVGWSFQVSRKEQQEWYNRVVGNGNKRFTICMKENDQPVGMVTLTNIDMVNRSAFHGIKLHPSCPKGQGVGTDAVMTLMQYAFDYLNLHRLDGEWFTYNTASIRLYKKCGWQEEGVKRQAVYRDGEYRDLVTVGILKEDYQKARERLGW